MSQTILEPPSTCGPVLCPPRLASPPVVVFRPRRERVLQPGSWDSDGFPVNLRPAPALPWAYCQYQFTRHFHQTEAVTRVMFCDTPRSAGPQLLLLRRRVNGQ